MVQIFPANDYPRIIDASQAQSKFRDRKFEPTNYNSGSSIIHWDNSGTSNDWFRVKSADGGTNITPPSNSSNGNGGYMFQIGCKNGKR